MDMLTSRGVDVSPARLSISDRAQLIMPYHLLLDKLEEKSLATAPSALHSKASARYIRIKLRAAVFASVING